MKSNQLKKIVGNISQWHIFGKELLKNVPTKKGIYVIRLAGGKSFGRLKGNSDILYIGKTESKTGGLKQRVSSYFSPDETQLTNIRINMMQKKYKMEIAWFVSDESNNLEHKLLNTYIGDHDELPPLNHAGCKKLKKTLRENLKVSDNMGKRLCS